MIQQLDLTAFGQAEPTRMIGPSTGPRGWQPLTGFTQLIGTLRNAICRPRPVDLTES
jgi:hypothetical protein